MSASYQTVQWNAFKRRYDLVLATGICLFLATFIIASKLNRAAGHTISDEILLMRAFGVCAILLLHIILCIGPLARLSPRFLPLLYNRRHLGVAMFLLALFHALLAIGFYHGFSDISPLVSLLTSNTQYRSVAAFPFEIPGGIAFFILFLMAATSHDFWLHNLSPHVWKSLHMLIYVAWGLLVIHVAMGALQSERNPAYVVMLGAGGVIVAALHLIAGKREAMRDANGSLKPFPAMGDGWAEVCRVEDIPENRGKVFALPGCERIAIFRYAGKFSAVSNLCAHQGGPLGEGRIIDDCITCPWHGYQYRPEDGCAPPPFTEKVPTFAIRVIEGRIQVNTTPLEPGTPVVPARTEGAPHVTS